jgi:hypothetical protein
LESHAALRNVREDAKVLFDSREGEAVVAQLLDADGGVPGNSVMASLSIAHGAASSTRQAF